MVRKKRKSRRKHRKKRTKTRKRRGGGPEIGAEKFINFYNQHESFQEDLQEKFPEVKNLGELIRNLTDNQVKRALGLLERPKTAMNGGGGGGDGDGELGLADIPWYVWIALVLFALYDSCRHRPPQHDSGGLGMWHSS